MWWFKLADIRGEVCRFVVKAENAIKATAKICEMADKYTTDGNVVIIHNLIDDPHGPYKTKKAAYGAARWYQKILRKSYKY